MPQPIERVESRRDGTGAPVGRPGTGERRRWLRDLRRVLGFPDYAAYMEHCQRAGHPPHLTEREYLADFFATRGRSPRCC